MKRTKNYINNQEDHHTKVDFEKEFISLLDYYEVEYNKEDLFEEEGSPAGAGRPM